MTNENEAQIFYQTFDKESDENHMRIFIFAGINDGKNFYANEDILYNEEYIEKIKNSEIKNIPVFTRDDVENKEMISKNYFEKVGILLKEDIYKFIESEIEGETAIYNIPIDKI